MNCAEEIKSNLDSAVKECIEQKERDVRNPATDFTRGRKLNLETLARIILSMQGNCLNIEIAEHFENSDLTPSKSAFVQQRQKLLPEFFIDVFDKFNACCTDENLYNGHRLYAVDGTDLNVAFNPTVILFTQKEKSKIYHLCS